MLTGVAEARRPTGIGTTPASVRVMRERIWTLLRHNIKFFLFFTQQRSEGGAMNDQYEETQKEEKEREG